MQQEVRGTEDLDAVDLGRVSPPHGHDCLGVRVAYGAKRLELASDGRRLGHILGDLDAHPRIAAGRHEIHLAGPRLPYCDVIAS